MDGWMDGWKDGWMVRNSRLEFLLRVVHTYIPKLLAAKLHTCKYVCSLRRSILVMRGNNMAPLGPVSALLCCVWAVLRPADARSKFPRKQGTPGKSEPLQ